MTLNSPSTWSFKRISSLQRGFRVCTSSAIFAIMAGVLAPLAAHAAGTPKTFTTVGGLNSEYSNFYAFVDTDLPKNGTDAQYNTIADEIKADFTAYNLPVGHRYLRVSAGGGVGGGEALTNISELSTNQPNAYFIYWDYGVNRCAQKMALLVSKLKSRGVVLDGIQLDYENKGNYVDFINSEQLTEDQNWVRWQANQSDSRYATEIRPGLVSRGFQFVSGKPDLYYLCYKDVDKPLTAKNKRIWDEFMDERLTRYLEKAIWTPAKTQYPSIYCGNYDMFKQVSPYITASLGGGPGPANGSLLRCGTDQTPVCYGWLNNSIAEKPPTNAIYPYKVNAFNGFLLSVNQARSARLSDPSGRLFPWVAWRSFVDKDSPTPMGNTNFYNENVLHIGLLKPTYFNIFLDDTTPTSEKALLNNLLKELDELAGYSDRAPLTTALADWNLPYLVTGMKANNRNLWRVTPNAGVNGLTVSNFKIAGSATVPPVFGTGIYRITFPSGSKIVTPTTEYAPGGYWVESPVNTSPTYSISALKINCGGPTVSPFTADVYASNQTISTTSAINRTGLIGPAPEAVYKTAHYAQSAVGPLEYYISGCTPSVTYSVRLHFCEIEKNFAGQRVFNVKISGVAKESNVDILALAGAKFKGLIRSYTGVPDQNGLLKITLQSVADEPILSGIEITPPAGAASANAATTSPSSTTY